MDTAISTLQLNKRIVNCAETMLYELESGYLETVVIPASEPRHGGHGIRANQYENCKWYQRYCALYSYPRPKKPRTIIKRQATITALNHIINGTIPGRQGGRFGANILRLLDFIKEELDMADRPKSNQDEMEGCPF